MSENGLTLDVRELKPIRVVSRSVYTDLRTGEYSQAIGNLFKEIESWLQAKGLDPHAGRLIGITLMGDGELVGYKCCAEISNQVVVDSQNFHLETLPGGRFAVASISKEPELIGPSIGQVYSRLLPESKLQVDPNRPAYEIYFEDYMEYCVAVL